MTETTNDISDIDRKMHGLGLIMRTLAAGVADLEDEVAEIRKARPILPHPCNGPLYAGWSPANYLCKVVEEIGAVGEAFDAYDRDRGDMEKWEHLMQECCDGIVAITGLMDCLGCDEGARQFFMRGVNKSNATRDGGKRFAECKLGGEA